MANSQKNKVFIICENITQYKKFVVKSKSNPMEVFYLSKDGSIYLRGLRELNFICLGNWQKRTDLKEIFETLMMCNIGTKLERKTEIYRLLYT